MAIVPRRLVPRRSWFLMGLALLWSGVAVGVLLGYHVPETLGMTS